MKNLLIVFVALGLSFAPALSLAKDCVKGKPCGNACIPQDKECKIAPPTAKRECKKGKPCGNACIAKDKVCKS